VTAEFEGEREKARDEADLGAKVTMSRRGPASILAPRHDGKADDKATSIRSAFGICLRLSRH
jgi:hypothetical protein